jgi:hypothetical protein
MFKRRQQEYRRGLVEKARPFLSGEEPRYFAIAQGSDPRLSMGAVVMGAVLVNGSLLGGDNYLPEWLGWLGLAVAIAFSAAGFFIRRRFLVRTEEHVYMFNLPVRRSDPIGPPISIADVASLPPGRPDKKSRSFGGERLWAPYGSKIDRDSLNELLLPAPPRP